MFFTTFIIHIFKRSRITFKKHIPYKEENFASFFKE